MFCLGRPDRSFGPILSVRAEYAWVEIFGFRSFLGEKLRIRLPRGSFTDTIDA